ncbi:PTS system mannose/fructose/N-acetylgalactosamine-transporter subunit IIB [Anaerorhabdus sp.]|uniref:PTS system mannose/fructose/N-acetylgalactosamine-transporter subunit IIB n=2 Tax=Anaerorhabdus sp. TaxID=1872524 RepID=UPI002B2183F4|nr:PTS sugar transporter subunit IIB [Anaerorhabdus sp.]MEA4874909.1 PTS sugar transporter subunit IIB [Anaerorhabdus sp.]
MWYCICSTTNYKMEFAVVRIDDRLIHGQVIMGWTHSKGVNTIIAVDDVVANDSFQCSLLQFATPPGVKSYILTVEKAAALILSGDLANKKIMLLVKGPQAILGLMDKGVEIKNVNVGNVRPKDYTKEIVSHIYARESDIEAWKELCSRIEVIGQILPDSPKTNLNDLMSKF